MDNRLKGGLIAAAAVAALAGGGAAIAGATGDDPSAPATTEGSALEAGDDGSARGDDGSAREDEGSAGDAETGPDDGNGQPVTGSPLDRASAVALEQTGGGQVTGSEIRDEEGYYEIEVTTADGNQVDVHLDSDFNVLDASSDGSGEN